MLLPPQWSETFFALDDLNDSAATSPVSVLDQMAYCSLAVPGVNALGIADWVAQINSASVPACLTGMLMWEGRLMIHWLEGPPDQLHALWKRIQADSRQHCLVPLLRRSGVPQRLFTAWQMQAASRNEMLAIVREAREQANLGAQAHDAEWQHAISTLSILLDPDLTACYAQAAQPQVSLALPDRQAHSA
jgi:hypothetical protein